MLARTDGRALAAAMLRETEVLSESERGYLFVDGQPNQQENVVLHYLDSLTLSENRELLTGFAEVLTDFLSGAYDGGATGPEVYED